jgi:SPP1 family predicted phage head-tail adaptor
MAFNAGNLRHRVVIERQTYLQDSAGDPIQDPVTGELRREWTTLTTVWADIAPLSAREFIASGATVSELSARITIRWFTGLLPTDRFNHSGVIYNPKGILPDLDSGREYITIPVGTGANDGQ